MFFRFYLIIPSPLSSPNFFWEPKPLHMPTIQSGRMCKNNFVQLIITFPKLSVVPNCATCLVSEEKDSAIHLPGSHCLPTVVYGYNQMMDVIFYLSPWPYISL